MLFRSSVAALASRSPRFFARSSESFKLCQCARGRFRGPGYPGSKTGCTLRAGHTQCSGCPPTDKLRVAQAALVTLDTLFAVFARPAPLRVVCLVQPRCALPACHLVLLMPTSPP